MPAEEKPESPDGINSLQRQALGIIPIAKKTVL